MFVIVPVLTLVLLGIILFLLDKPLFEIHIGTGIYDREETSISVSVLTEVKKIFTFNTMEVVYKTVFPHDFITPDTNWRRLKNKIEHGDTLTVNETEQWYIYNLCSDIGINVEKNVSQFVVMTSILKVGYNMEEEAYPAARDSSEIEKYVYVSEDRKTIYIRLPQPRIVDFIIEDSSSDKYAYPDLEIQPEQWRSLSFFVSQKLKQRIQKEGMLEVAGTKGKTFLKKMMQNAGFESIVFIE
jgi:hypothetical protein